MRYIYTIILMIFTSTAYGKDIQLEGDERFLLCSQYINQRHDFAVQARKIQTNVLFYNAHHYKLTSRLSLREQQVHNSEIALKGNRSDKALWHSYEQRFDAYKRTYSELLEWNNRGNIFEEKFTQLVNRIEILNILITSKCDGEWFLKTIRFFCRPQTEKHFLFCETFDIF